MSIINTNVGWFRRMKPFIAVIFLQLGRAGMDVLCKAALNQGMSSFVFVVYRHAVATILIAPFALIFDKKTRPKMTVPIFIKIVLLGFLEPVVDQNLYYLGMKHTTATFTAAMGNILPAITFVMAWLLRLEKVRIRAIRSQAKIFGTLATVAGAMIMTLVKGPIIELFWTKASNSHQNGSGGISLQSSIKGSLMITIGCFSWACFMILLAITLESYPAELSLTASICFLGMVEGTVAALIMERGHASVWAIHWDYKLAAALYSGVVCSGAAYYIQGIVMKDRGPVFVTAFNPLNMVIVAIVSSFFLSEQLFLGRVMGAIVIVAGLYLVVWGKSKDHISSSSPDQAVDDKKALPVQVIDREVTETETSQCETIAVHMSKPNDN